MCFPPEEEGRQVGQLHQSDCSDELEQSLESNPLGMPEELTNSLVETQTTFPFVWTLPNMASATIALSARICGGTFFERERSFERKYSCQRKLVSHNCKSFPQMTTAAATQCANFIRRADE